MTQFSYADVVAATSPSSNWSKFGVHPVADRLLWFLANYAPIHPNALTIGASVLGFAAAFCYLQGDAVGMIAGAALFYSSFAIDTIDGALARLTNQRSATGAWLDTMTDFLRSMTVAPAFAVGVYRQVHDVLALYLGFAVMGVGLWYYYQAEISEKLTAQRPAQMAATSNAPFMQRMRRLGIVPSPFGLADYEAVYLVIFPLLGRPLEGMVVALIAGVLSRVAVAFVVLARLRHRFEQDPQ